MMRISSTGRKIGTAPIFPIFSRCPFSSLQSNTKSLVLDAKQSDKASFGFTMVELLTVIAIIAILAAMLMPALTRARQKAWETTSRTMISSLEAALATYMSEYGNYPQDDDAAPAGSGTVKTCVNLITRLEDSDEKNNGKIYASFRDQDKISGSLKDPWGEPYCYRYDSDNDGDIDEVTGSTYGLKFNIWSKGVDKQTDPSTPGASINADDITNWKTTKGQQ